MIVTRHSTAPNGRETYTVRSVTEEYVVHDMAGWPREYRHRVVALNANTLKYETRLHKVQSNHTLIRKAIDNAIAAFKRRTGAAA